MSASTDAVVAVAFAAVEAMPEGVLVLDGSWTVRYANPVAARELGTSVAALIGMPYAEVQPGVVGTAFERAYARVMRTRVAETIEEQYQPWDRWFRNRILPCGDGLALLFSEVTEERRARHTLLGELEVLQQVVDHAACGIVLKDLEGHYLLANRAAAEPTGRSARQMLGHTAEDFYGPQIAGPRRAAELEAQRARRAISQEECIAFAADDPRSYLTVTFPAYDATGDLVGTGCIFTDITDRKQAEADLEASQRRYRDVFAATSLGQLVLRADGDVLDANDAFCRMIDYARDELVGTSARHLVAGDKAWADRQDRIRRQGHEGYEIEEDLIRRDGSTLPVLVTITVLDDSQDELVVSCIVRDQSQVRALQERLVAAERMEAVGRLASGIAHDVNNVLSAVSGYAQLLSGEVAESERGARHLAGIFRSVERAGDLVTQLMAFARQQHLVPVEQDLCSVVLDLDDMLRRLLPERVKLVVQRDIEAAVRADASQLQQVVLNLVLNARDALPDGGTIHVSIDVTDLAGDDTPDLPAGRYARMVVQDDGAGMPPEVASRCFEPFFTTRAGSGGNGLGLSTAYGIARQSGGDLCVESTPGEGSRFTLLLPALSSPAGPARAGHRADGSTPAGRPGTAVPGSVAPKGLRILVADDDPPVLDVVQEVLGALGHDVVVAKDGRSALALAGRLSDPPALLVTDVDMPGLDGPSLAGRLREQWPHLRVLMVSGHRRPPTSDPFLAKPFTREELTDSVQAALLGAGTP